jgi:uncharacterized protein (DUF2147 family)
MKSGLGLTAVRIVAVGGCAMTLLFPAPARADAAQDAIAGTWLTEGGDSKVEISRSGTSYGGMVVWLKEPDREGKPLHDVNNSNASLRDRPIMGLEILTGFTHESSGVWSGGTVYSPRKGRSYPAELSIAKDGRLDIKVKDGIFFKHLYWTR